MQEHENRRLKDKKLNDQIYQLGNKVKDSSLYNLLEKLRKSSQNLLKMETKNLKALRYNKSIEQRRAYAKNLQLEMMKPGHAVLRMFSDSKPLNSGDKFLDVKQKQKLLFSDRAFTRKPNVVTGVFKKRILTQTKLQRREWINRKFSQYDKIVSQQTGPMRIFLKKRQQYESGEIPKKPILVGKLQNSSQLFSICEPDNVEVFDKLKKTFSTNAYTFKNKTQGSLQASMQLNCMPMIKQKLMKNSIRLKNSKRVATDFP